MDMDRLSQGDLDGLTRLSATSMLVLDRAGNVLHMGETALAGLTATQAVTVKNGALSARRKSEDKAIRDALAALSPSKPDAIVCLRTRESHPIAVIDLRLLPGGAIAWRMTELLVRPMPSVARLRSVFGLTPAEARVAGALLSGLGLRGIARENGVEAETVRSQAKRIRAKTGARTQNQLLAMLLAVGPGLGPPV